MYPSNSRNCYSNANFAEDTNYNDEQHGIIKREMYNPEIIAYPSKGVPVDIPKSRHKLPPKPKPIHINDPKKLASGESNNPPPNNLLQPRIPVKHLLHTGVPIALFHKSYSSTSTIYSDGKQSISQQQTNINSQLCNDYDNPNLHQAYKINNLNSISTDSNGSSVSTNTHPNVAFAVYNETGLSLSKRTSSTKSLEGMASETSTDSNIDSIGGLINNYYDPQNPPNQPNSWVFSKCRNCAAPFVPKYKIIRHRRYPSETIKARNVNINDTEVSKSENKKNVSNQIIGSAASNSTAVEQQSICCQSHKSNCSSISTSTNNDNNHDIRTGSCSILYGIEPQPLSRSTSSGIGATLCRGRASSNCGVGGNFSVNRGSMDSYSEASLKTIFSSRQEKNLQEIDNKAVPTNSPSDALRIISQDKTEVLSLSRSLNNGKDGDPSQHHETILSPPVLAQRGTYECEHKTSVENYDSVSSVDPIEVFDDTQKRVSKDEIPFNKGIGILHNIFKPMDHLNESHFIETRKYQKFCCGECRISYRQVQKLKRQRSRQLQRQQHIESQPANVIAKADKERSIPVGQRRDVQLFKNYQNIAYNKQAEPEIVSPTKKSFYRSGNMMGGKELILRYPSDIESWDEDEDDDDEEEGYTNIDECCYDEDLRYTDMKNKNSLFF